MTRRVFRALLQRGVGIADGAGTSVRAFLQDVLGIDPAYIEEKLQTVFLDGRPVDDLDRAVVHPGSVLALSGAMPGLAGATMRRAGFYARFREGITHAEAKRAEENGEEGVVVVKLFNRPLADFADSLAARPLLAPADALDVLDAETAEDGWIRLDVTLVAEEST